MNSIIEELLYGNVGQNTGCRDASAEEKQLLGYIARHHDSLDETLTDKQKDIFAKYEDCYMELMSINERKTFVYAFRLGARIAIEVLLPNTDSSNIC